MQEKSFLIEILAEIGANAKVIAWMIISMTTSAVVYLNKVKNGAEFKIFNFIVNIAVALVAAFLVSSLLEWAGDDATNENLVRAAMVVVGITANKILEIVEEKGLNILLKHFKK